MGVNQLLLQLPYGSPHCDLIANPPNQEVEGQRGAVPQLPNPADQRTANLPVLTTALLPVSQDRLGKPQPEGHPRRGRLPFIVRVRLHLPTHYCVSQSSPVSHVSRKPSQPSPRPAFDRSSARLDRLTKSNLRSQGGLGGDGHGSRVPTGPTEFYPVIPRSPAGATP